jgi:alpha-D-xyloside xylohydrolase
LWVSFWQCKLRYSSQEQILRIASEYVNRGLPISVIVVDFHHWIHEGDWRFSTALEPSDGCWPDPTAMANQLEEMGIKCAVSVWPDVQSDAINYVNMSSQGLLIRGADGKSKPSVQGKDYIDAFNPATRKYMFDQLVDGYISHGIDTFWMDATEPQGANIGEWFYRLDDGKTHKDTEVAMAWVQQYHRMASV